MKSLLAKAATANHIALTEEQLNKLVKYLELMQTWNKVFNLTSITEPRETVYLHIIDSLLTAPFLTGKRLLDVGSGAGLPGIPLAILHPEQEWVLLDKNIKKTRFMIQAAAELGLKNVQVAHSRAEDFHPEQNFDHILSRAYATLALFIETTRHLLNKNGTFIALKGRYPHEEIAEISNELITVSPVTMTGMTLERHIVCIVKKE